VVDVALHGTLGNCWMILNSDVYNMTGFMSVHPGGASTLLSSCGADGTSTFDALHGASDPYYLGRLEPYKIGTVSVG
jgi:cytochrome b involved in lipid metabolism